MSAPEHSCLAAAVHWLAIPWEPSQTEQLRRYAEWLYDEGARIGGLGPREGDRVWPRHICDSLVFGRGIRSGQTVLDVGSGIGLPGVPIAIAHPEASVTLLDRSGRRTDALHRVCRHLGVEAEIVQLDVGQWTARVDRLVFRASLALPESLETAARLLTRGGEAWFGLARDTGSDAFHAWRSNPPEPPRGLSVEEVAVPSEVLDSPVWLLRIIRA